MKRLKLAASLAMVASLSCLAQSTANTEKPPVAAQAAEKPPKNFYQLNFVIRELENEKVINSRSYSMVMASEVNFRGAIRAGEKIPFITTSGTNSQWQQLNIGVDIDCRKLEEVGDRLSLSVTADVSSLVEAHPENSVPGGPIVRTNRWESTVIVPVKQPTILFSSDDPASKRKMQLQLTATPFR